MCAVKAPGFGDNRKNTLLDMAIASGGTVSFIYVLNILVVILYMKYCNIINIHKTTLTTKGFYKACMLYNFIINS